LGTLTVGGEQRPPGIKKHQLQDRLYSFDYQPQDENSEAELIFVASFCEAQQYAELRRLGHSPYVNNIHQRPQEAPIRFPYLDKELKQHKYYPDLVVSGCCTCVMPCWVIIRVDDQCVCDDALLGEHWLNNECLEDAASMRCCLAG
jgi:hypothetical protein